MRAKYKVLLLLFLIPFLSKSALVQDTLYINAGEKGFNGTVFFPVIYFNESNQFDSANAILVLDAGDDLELTIINKDTNTHQIRINDGAITSNALQFNQSQTINLSALGDIYRIEDILQDYRLLGLSTVIYKESPGFNYHWQIREYQSDLNQDILNGVSYNQDSLRFNFFTINDNIHPNIQFDSTATVHQNVGDSIYIIINNCGMMAHSVHYHGYHIELVYSSINNEQLHWIKDSIPIKPGEVQIHLLIPFQEGSYPVHDHNLVATTGDGNYPNGMITMLHISP